MPQELRPGVMGDIPIPYRKFFWKLHISLKPFCQFQPNFAQMFLGWSSSKVMFGMSGVPRGGLKWLIILIFKNLLANQQCQKIDTWHITLINLENRNPVWPNDFDLQLGCCISDAFSIFNVMQLILVKINWHIKWKYLIQKFHDICLSYYFKEYLLILNITFESYIHAKFYIIHKI
jgi:hypothetical protein